MTTRLTTRLALVLTLLAGPLVAQGPAPGPDAVPTFAGRLRSPAELDELLAPLALYPDALVAIVLPASTKPVDLMLAERYLQAGGSPARLGEVTAEASVRAIAHHRETLAWLNRELLWTRDLAAAFLAQPGDVMQAIQRLRRAAHAIGNLRSTAQHDVIVRADGIRIVPANPDVIHAPRYDARVVYYSRPLFDRHPLVTFGPGYRVGSWLSYDCDWRHRRVSMVDPLWYSHSGWRDYRFHHGPSWQTFTWVPWTPAPRIVVPRHHYPHPDYRRDHPRHHAPPPRSHPGEVRPDHRPPTRGYAPEPRHEERPDTPTRPNPDWRERRADRAEPRTPPPARERVAHADPVPAPRPEPPADQPRREDRWTESRRPYERELR